MHDEWLTLTEAARQLGISPRTARRWIHDGKLRAELRPGPYGQQYLVPLDGIQAVQVAHDLRRAEREADEIHLLQALDTYLLEREEGLVDAINELRQELRAATQRQEEQLRSLQALLQQVLVELRTARQRDAGGRGD